jgi:hypothetical protein
MTDYGVRHRCVAQVFSRCKTNQCTRRGRWVKCDYWFCRQHYIMVRNLPCAEIPREVRWQHLELYLSCT